MEPGANGPGAADYSGTGSGREGPLRAAGPESSPRAWKMTPSYYPLAQERQPCATVRSPTGLDDTRRRMNDKRERDQERYRLHAAVCRVLPDPKRLMLLDVLGEGEHSVGELADRLGCMLANASQHLTVLRSAGLVGTRRDGNTIYYHLAEPEILAACDVIHRIVGRRMGLITERRRSANPSMQSRGSDDHVYHATPVQIGVAQPFRLASPSRLAPASPNAPMSSSSGPVRRD